MTGMPDCGGRVGSLMLVAASVCLFQVVSVSVLLPLCCSPDLPLLIPRLCALSKVSSMIAMQGKAMRNAKQSILAETQRTSTKRGERKDENRL
ncbi:uncharacterized protein SPSK_10142 [Sporothrix schenckii 1099-18]|uniref:Uncharacterized protein n=1 Tax=Sporothrix schenckii 1099-18 TaxID=1397361 RepID=A0A0F2MAQ8_SPOSC|nr:uncharacterized protein SPSK_10142 [Sporothrix schenckii 1099-18]KJR85910.1 hypothetical protein SPSK_10142 [Sporothrix schenckii 1099-18]